MKDAAIRAARTFLQTALGVYLAGLIANATPLLSDLANIDLLNAAGAAGIVAALTFVQNALEETNVLNVPRG
jgi:hypothetical protein